MPVWEVGGDGKCVCVSGGVCAVVGGEWGWERCVCGYRE